jgi:malonyl-CoA/methylmalonyl-CoA synthetase
MLTHGNLASNALTLHRLWGFEDGDVLLHALPIYHVHGLFVALNTAFLNASTILFLDRFDTGIVLEQLPSATVMMGVPTFYSRLLASPDFGPAHYDHMRLFISGSAPLTEQTFAAFEARTGQRILERYGMSETGMITSNPLEGERRAGTVGYPLPGVEIRVCDDAGNELPPGEIGMVEVRGPNVFTGYWRLPEKTAAEFRADGFFVTGDLGHLAADGRLTLAGREKDLIITGGLNVYPKEVELCLDALEGIRESAVIGVPHPDFGEAVVAVCVPSKDNLPDEAGLRAALKNRLARFKQPKKYIQAASLPRNSMGKVQKNHLRQQYRELFQP